MKTIDKIAVSEFEPSNNLVGWYNPVEKTLKFFENGEWQAQKAEEGRESYPEDSVDIGLSVRWRSMNIGAEKPSDYGDYYAWGETETKENYSSETYTYSDNPEVLPADHDVATVKLGSDWRMPTVEEVKELVATKENTTNYQWTWRSVDGHIGWEIKYLDNGNSIFLPAAGYWLGTNLYNKDSYGYYWSSSLKTDSPNVAWSIIFFSIFVDRSYGVRFIGYPVRPVTPLKGIDKEISNLNKKIDSLDRQVNSLDSRVDSLEYTVATKQEIDALFDEGGGGGSSSGGSDLGPNNGNWIRLIDYTGEDYDLSTATSSIEYGSNFDSQNSDSAYVLDNLYRDVLNGHSVGELGTYYSDGYYQLDHTDIAGGMNWGPDGDKMRIYLTSDTWEINYY